MDAGGAWASSVTAQGRSNFINATTGVLAVVTLLLVTG